MLVGPLISGTEGIRNWRFEMKRLIFNWMTLAILMASTIVADTYIHDYSQKSFARVAKQVPLSGQLRIRGVPLEENLKVDLDLVRFRVWSPDAEILVHTDNETIKLPPPTNWYFRGSLVNRPNASVHLTVLASGETRGYIEEKGSFWFLGDPADSVISGDRLAVRKIEDAALNAGGNFDCRQDDLHTPSAKVSQVDKLFGTLRSESNKALGITNNAVIAIETDTDYLDEFGGNTTDATNYAGDLVAYASTRYGTEVDTSLSLGTVSLWTTTDPWTQSSSLCSLFEFGKYWNDNNSHIDRSLVHFLSGNNTLAGVAWVGVLCNGGFTYNITGAGCAGLTPLVSNWGGEYGYTGGISGSFDINSPTVIWDIVAFTHELGHNFNSPHTHCYEGLGGPAAIDECYAGQCGTPDCYCGGTSLPGPAGSGSGTIMSYCHLLSPGMSNIGWSLGTGHPFGTDPVRVPDRMKAHVATAASANPGCLDVIAPPDPIFDDGFESGDTTAWSSTSP